MEILQMPIYIYIVIISILERQNLEYPYPFLITIISTLILTPILFLIYFFSFLYKKLINYLLIKLYPNVFIAMMEGLDSICCNQSNCIPNVLLLLETSDTDQELYKKTVQMIESAMKSEHKKLFYSRGSLLGYHYFYRNRLAAKDYVTKAKNTIRQGTIDNKAKLSKIFASYDIRQMPDNGRALMEVILVPGKIAYNMVEASPTNANYTNLNKAENLKLMAFRLHHCLGDGKAIMNLFISIFADVSTSLNPCQLASLSNSQRKYSDIPLGERTPEINRLKDWPLGLVDDNVLRGYNLCEEKHLAWFSDTGKERIEKIKDLKRLLPGVTFLDVINTCISSSLYDHCEKHELPIPETVIGGVILSPAIYSFSYGVGNFTMTNRFSCAAFHMPIGFDDCKLITRLKQVKKEYERVKKCVDVQFNYWIAQNICQTLPTPIVSFVCSKVPITFGVSSLPGCEKFTLFCGSQVRDFIFMLPNSPKCGLHFIIYTYGGDFRFALSVDKSVAHTHWEAQEIVDNVIKHLDEMHRLCSAGKLTLL